MAPIITDLKVLTDVSADQMYKLITGGLTQELFNRLISDECTTGDDIDRVLPNALPILKHESNDLEIRCYSNILQHPYINDTVSRYYGLRFTRSCFDSSDMTNRIRRAVLTKPANCVRFGAYVRMSSYQKTSLKLSKIDFGNAIYYGINHSYNPANGDLWFGYIDSIGTVTFHPNQSSFPGKVYSDDIDDEYSGRGQQTTLTIKELNEQGEETGSHFGREVSGPYYTNAERTHLAGLSYANNYNFHPIWQALSAEIGTQVYRSYSFWVFATKAELDHYLQTGEYETALNYSPPPPKNYMDLNVTGNSVQTNATFEFIDPKPGLQYMSPQQIKMEWTISGATKNPNVKREIIFDIPAGNRCFCMFDGRNLKQYTNNVGVTYTINEYNNDILQFTTSGQNTTGVLALDNIYAMFKSELNPTGGIYNVKIYTPYIFLRQVYYAFSRDEIPDITDAWYEKWKEGTDSWYVRPDGLPDGSGTARPVVNHILEFPDIATMKAASDADYGG